LSVDVDVHGFLLGYEKTPPEKRPHKTAAKKRLRFSWVLPE
jgi:hypothetical protein